LSLNEKDARAIQAVREGDGDAFRALVDRHGGTVYSVLRRLVNDADLAEELAQETFIKAYTGIDGFRGESGVGTWLVQIAINLVRDRRRAEQRTGPVISLDRFGERSGENISPAEQEEKTDPLRRLIRRELVTRLEKEVLRLPDEYREVFVLKHIEGLSYETIAHMTGDSVGTLKVRAHRSRMKLRKRLSSKGKGTEEDHGRDPGALSGW
jgi:RNA polymerase sigma-70 factor (ECF subfamily)